MQKGCIKRCTLCKLLIVVSLDLTCGGLVKSFFSDNHVVNVLVLGKSVVEVCDRLLDLVIDLFVGHAANLLFVRKDLGTKSNFLAVFVSCGRNDYFADKRKVHDIILDLLGIDVLSVAENDEVLFAACDVKAVYFVNSSVVACVEPSVGFKHLGGKFRHFVIAHHNSVALYADLALAVLVGVVDNCINDGKDGSDGLGNDVVIVVYGEDEIGRASCRERV